MPKRLKLKKIRLSGYKSIGNHLQEIPLNDVTLLIGPNGVGKSNIVSFFRMLSFLVDGNLALFVGKQGGAERLLYFGYQTDKIKTELHFENQEGTTDTYCFDLTSAARDKLIFTKESFEYQRAGYDVPYRIDLNIGGEESELQRSAATGNASIPVRFVSNVLVNCKSYQFHNTSMESKIRGANHIRNTSYLRDGGDNLAAFLYRMKTDADTRKNYDKIVHYVRMIFPAFDDFELKSAVNPENIYLDWKEKKSDYLFGPSQLSDGTLRFTALATLLLQPLDTLPKVIVIDEPELGLHPTAIAIFADIVRAVSENTQVVLATQSPRLVDEFEASEVVVMERDPKEQTTIFKTLDEQTLAEWLAEYSLSELWEKNVIGGKP